MLNPEQKQFGLKLAKLSILNEFSPQEYEKPISLSAEYQTNQASFVTLNAGGDNLRGCIGSIIPHQSLGDDIWINAKNAAFRDPRFPALTLDEIGDDDLFTIQISVLTVPQKIEFADVNQMLGYLQENKPGLIISNGVNQSTFLPSVWEQLPDAKLFLNHLVQKSGANPANFWSEFFDWEFQVYHTDTFQEIWHNIKV